MSATQRPTREERKKGRMTRTILVTKLRNPYTGEEKTIYGNYSMYQETKAGFSETIESSLKKYEMDDETFIKYATEK